MNKGMVVDLDVLNSLYTVWRRVFGDSEWSEDRVDTLLDGYDNFAGGEFVRPHRNVARTMWLYVYKHKKPSLLDQPWWICQDFGMPVDDLPDVEGVAREVQDWITTGGPVYIVCEQRYFAPFVVYDDVEGAIWHNHCYRPGLVGQYGWYTMLFNEFDGDEIEPVEESDFYTPERLRKDMKLHWLAAIEDEQEYASWVYEGGADPLDRYGPRGEGDERPFWTALERLGEIQEYQRRGRFDASEVWGDDAT
jgi:hypothetical protein